MRVGRHRQRRWVESLRLIASQMLLDQLRQTYLNQNSHSNSFWFYRKPSCRPMWSSMTLVVVPKTLIVSVHLWVLIVLEVRCRNSKTIAVFFCRYYCIGRCALSSWFSNRSVCGEMFFFRVRRGEKLKKKLFEERVLSREKSLLFLNEKRWRSRSNFFRIFVQNRVR